MGVLVSLVVDTGFGESPVNHMDDIVVLWVYAAGKHCHGYPGVWGPWDVVTARQALPSW
jgi:hypothetical protein